MKIIVAPDKFKGSLSSFDACRAIATGVRQAAPQAILKEFPMSDGGDGFAAIMQHYTGSSTITCKTCDPLGRGMQGDYQWNENGKTAIIELAVASGHALLDKQEQNPLYTSTYGTGLQIKDAIERGAGRIILGLGGSATNDAGMGILEALGFRFLDEEGHWLGSCGRNLLLIESIIAPDPAPAIKFELACDVQNTLYGSCGAAYVYAPQKGAGAEEVVQLDEGLRHFAAVVYRQTGRQVADIPGAGAAGGIAAGLMGFLDVELQGGAEMVIAAGGIEKEMAGASLLVTGEGKIDGQTKNGKVVNEIAALANRYNVPAIAYCGIADINRVEAATIGLKAVYAIADSAGGKDHSIKYAKELLQIKVAATLVSGLS